MGLQEVSTPNKTVPLCGCGSCFINWTKAGLDLKTEVMAMRCADLADAASKATPPVLITQNEDCSKMLGELLLATIDHMNVSTLVGSGLSCPPNAKVSGLGLLVAEAGPPTTATYQLPFPLDFGTTSATCMAAPEMDYYADIKIWNEGRMDGWNSARDEG
jgi:hypothetical protein